MLAVQRVRESTEFDRAQPGQTQVDSTAPAGLELRQEELNTRPKCVEDASLHVRFLKRTWRRQAIILGQS